MGKNLIQNNALELFQMTFSKTDCFMGPKMALAME